ncbi:MAG: hypothetical protein ACM3NH_01795 [Candidatus Saccharibacteria bacterium]
MKKTAIAVAVIVLSLLAASASAQTFVESWAVADKAGSVNLTYDGQADLKVDASQGIFIWGLGTDGWSEGYVSYYRNLSPWLQVSAGAGMEQTHSHWRTAASVWAGKGPFSSFLALEHGASGFWYSYKGTVSLSKRLAVGLFSRQFVGTGPMAQVTIIGKTAVWASYCPRSRNTVIGLVQGF